MGQHVKINVEGLRRFAAQIAAGSEPIKRALKQAAARYRGFLQEHFVSMSRGGWTPLAESTKRKRRGAQQGSRKSRGKRGKAHAASGTFAILRDTGTLFNAIAPSFSGQPGAIEEQIQNGLRVGYGGPSKYQKGKSKASIADIAAFHQEGAGRLPVRQIIVPPTQAVADAMTGYVQKAVDQIARDTNI